MTTKPRRLSEKTVIRILAEYNLPRRVRDHLATLGDLVWTNQHLDRTDVFWCSASYRGLVVLTTCGPLGVTVYEDWIACVFDDADLGHAAVDASMPSGKWNHHAFVGYCHRPTSRDEIIQKLDTMLANFKRRLGWITDRSAT